MAEEGTVVGTGRRGEIRSARGSEAGKDTKYEEIEREKVKQRWLQSKGWGGIAGVRSRPADWEKQFNEYYRNYKKKQSKNSAQKKAVSGTESEPE